MPNIVRRGQKAGMQPVGSSRIYWFNDRRSRINAERMAALAEQQCKDDSLKSKNKKELVAVAKERGIPAKGKNKQQLLDELGG